MNELESRTCQAVEHNNRWNEEKNIIFLRYVDVQGCETLRYLFHSNDILRNSLISQTTSKQIKMSKAGWFFDKKTSFLSMITCLFIPVQAYMCITSNLRNTAFSQDTSGSRGSRFAWSISYKVTMYQNKFVFAFSFPKIKEKKVRQTMGKLRPLLLDVGLHCWTLLVLSNSHARHSHHHARENRAHFIFIHWLLLIF